MIRAVIFDLDDTLYDYKTLNAEAECRIQALVCHTLGIGADRFEEAFLCGRKETKERLGDIAASHNRMLYFQAVLEHLGCRPLPMSLQMYDTYWNTFLAKMTLYPGARQLIDTLHERGIKVGICTDLTAHIQHRKLETLGLADDIDFLVTSEEAGREKPAPEMFRLCLAKSGMQPEEVCFVGDDYRRDIKGALAAGIHAVWFCPDGKPVCGDEGKGYDVVMDYEQLGSVLERMGNL